MNKRILIPTLGPTDWRRLLSVPQEHWKRGRSAFETSISWEYAADSKRGLPDGICAAFDQVVELRDAEVLMAIPEHEVALKGRGQGSHSDVWALLKTGAKYISLSVEGKAGEEFGDPIPQWLSTSNRTSRWHDLCKILQVPPSPVPNLRYQLFHRTASSILEAQRFVISHAVMIVQNFPSVNAKWSDFEQFVIHLGAQPVRGRIVNVPRSDSIMLFLGWIDCSAATDSQVCQTVE